VSNPLNEQISKLLAEIIGLERDRSDEQEALENPTSTESADYLMEIKRHKNSIDFLTREIDLRRQELISLELLMLDNSVKGLHSVTGQVDESIKSLEGTTKEVLKSSSKLERLTEILIFATLLLGITAVYQVTVTLGQTNSYAEWTGIIGIPVLVIYLLVKIRQELGKARESVPSFHKL
jgi:hypothetical protein